MISLSSNANQPRRGTPKELEYGKKAAGNAQHVFVYTKTAQYAKSIGDIEGYNLNLAASQESLHRLEVYIRWRQMADVHPEMRLGPP